jgi:hypothetical protein
MALLTGAKFLHTAHHSGFLADTTRDPEPTDYRKRCAGSSRDS